MTARGPIYFNLTHAKHDPAHCLAPGLFRSLKRGDRKNLKLDVTYVYGNTTIKFWGPEPLGADDMRILQGLVAMAAVPNEITKGILLLQSDPKTDQGTQLRQLLHTQFDASGKDALIVKGSFSQLAREVGYAVADGGSAFKAIRACLERLWSVSVIVDVDGRRQGFRILSEYRSDSADGKLFVALNPRLADAVVGNHYLRIEMAEVRNLNTDPARLMHQRLHWINAGRTERVTLDTLCSYVWPDECQAEAMKKRRQIARKALEELAKIGWEHTEYSSGKFSITRPKTSNIKMPPA